ncbi:zonular occludens toxin domain-containing protein [Novosphingobium album (ex Liu et al. 2023)]|uniref:Zonular occludens toxin domain-containing protein n=1 Tax=Novosphingobium album (ex Liu et al. 2023) TaxID=3031130 RepID=A0ABT5WPB4_9SPHN|nr:zonular occludens toxin domain-containing protein [Novosphingobium album (ex Liu et al. 2023)]MDE8651894.1 zonular occludens toxin domain-containing protein [Novosphingobium album (ex Liu et al. 2023)]
MAITAYTGVPGAGKSYAMIEQVILPGVRVGRRVLTNIGGVQPARIAAYCAAKWPADDLGEVVVFDGSDALRADFFPTEETGDEDTFVKGGDLLVFDEWRLTFPNRGAVPNARLEPFLRWHRHLTDSRGIACDVVIGTQLLTDIHRDFRGLVERSYKFRKLKSVGLPKFYQWDAYDGHLQPKGEGYAKGNGKYKREIFELYRSYSTDGDGKELSTDKRTSVFTKSVVGIALGVCLMFGLGGYGVYRFFLRDDVAAAKVGTKPPGAAVPLSSAPSVSFGGHPPRPQSPYRIAGFVDGPQGVRVVLSDDKGSVRVVGPDGFDFDRGRPIYGVLDGEAVVADDRLDLGSRSGAGSSSFGLTM